MSGIAVIQTDSGTVTIQAYNSFSVFVPKSWMKHSMFHTFIVNGVAKISLSDEEWDMIKDKEISRSKDVGAA